LAQKIPIRTSQRAKYRSRFALIESACQMHHYFSSHHDGWFRKGRIRKVHLITVLKNNLTAALSKDASKLLQKPFPATSVFPQRGENSLEIRARTMNHQGA
jgi:hypothetical protein